jgi:ribonuclease G
MRKDILISVEPQETRVAVVEGARLEEFYVERAQIERLVGNVYKGKVQSITTGIGAAFIEIGMPKNGFLYVSDIVGISSELEENVELVVTKRPRHQPNRIEDIVKKDQEIMVQVTKEPFGNKGPRLTTKISLPGRYIVLMPKDDHIGISKRIEDPKERQRLRQVLEGLPVPKGMGVIVRTAAEKRSKRDFVRDLRFLVKLWRRIEANFNRNSAPSLLHQEHGLIFRILRDLFTEDIDRLIVDSKPEYKEIFRYVMQLMPHLRKRIELYREIEPLFEKRRIEEQIEKIYKRKVELKSGGYIIIEQTESLVAIDVNSGRYIGKKDIEETVFNVNMEAAKEVARQIKLRDLGGIIVIDFIDMKSGEHRKKVFKALEEELKLDKAKTNILQISELGLVQMTRQRSRKTVESVAYQVCPYCQGKGATKSVQTMAIGAIRKMKIFFSSNRSAKRIELAVHPDVASRLFNEDRNSITYLERHYRAGINIKPDTSLHIEQVKIQEVGKR